MDVTPFLLNGRWVTTDSTAPVQNPHTGETIALVCQADRAHLDDAIAGAERAFRDTRAMPRHQRAALLAQVAAALAAQKSELSRLMATEAGKPLQFAAGEGDRAVATFTVAAGEGKRLSGEWLPTDWTPAGEGYLAMTKRVPLGSIAAFAPFNFPLNLVAHKIAPCLASGNTMVLKPPPQAPLTSLRLGGLLELGGNAAAVLHVDADLGWASRRLALGAFAYAGQVCISVQRILIHEALYERFVEQFLLDVEALQVGDPLVGKTVIGPLIDQAAADRVERWVTDAVNGGAKALTSITRSGNTIAPIVLTHADPTMAVSCEEVFGPVVTLAPYRSFQEALATVNDSRYRL